MEPPKITIKEIAAVKSENANNVAMAFIAKLKANITSIIEIALLIVSLYVKIKYVSCISGVPLLYARR